MSPAWMRQGVDPKLAAGSMQTSRRLSKISPGALGRHVPRLGHRSRTINPEECVVGGVLSSGKFSSGVLTPKIDTEVPQTGVEEVVADAAFGSLTSIAR